MKNMDPKSLVASVERSIAAGDWASAKSGLVQLITQNPGSADLWVQLSYVESYLGGYRQARAAAIKAAAARPGSLGVVQDVLSRLRTFNQVPEMHDYIRRLGGPRRLPIPLLISAASQFSSVNDQATAMTLLDEAKSGDPDFPTTLVARSQVLMYLARFAEAKADIIKALKRAPGIAQAWWLASRLGKATATENHVQEIEAQLTPSGKLPTPTDIALLCHALHKELDDLGRTEQAWEALSKGNRSKRETLRYASEETRQLIDLLCSSAVDKSTEVVEPAIVPIFIIGMHRSGTTLLEQMLDGHPRVQGVGELYDFTSAMRYETDHQCQGVIDQVIVERAFTAGFNFKAVGGRYLQGLQWRLKGNSHFTDKLPSNFLNAGFICEALPQAKLLHMVRDPVEVCFSNLRELFSSANPYSYDQIELADFYIEYHKLMAHWRKTYPGRIFDIRYDRMVRDPEAVMREVCEFCALEFTPEMLAIGNRKRGVSTASAVQVREGIQVRDVPKWKPYETYLQPMITRLRQGGVLEGWEQA